jgi:hypothetical protein
MMGIYNVQHPGGRRLTSINLKRDVLWVKSKGPSYSKPSGWHMVLGEAAKPLARQRSGWRQGILTSDREGALNLAIGLKWMPFLWDPFCHLPARQTFTHAPPPANPGNLTTVGQLLTPTLASANTTQPAPTTPRAPGNYYNLMRRYQAFLEKERTFKSCQMCLMDGRGRRSHYIRSCHFFLDKSNDWVKMFEASKHITPGLGRDVCWNCLVPTA